MTLDLCAAHAQEKLREYQADLLKVTFSHEEKNTLLEQVNRLKGVQDKQSGDLARCRRESNDAFAQLAAAQGKLRALQLRDQGDHLCQLWLNCDNLKCPSGS